MNSILATLAKLEISALMMQKQSAAGSSQGDQKGSFQDMALKDMPAYTQEDDNTPSTVEGYRTDFPAIKNRGRFDCRRSLECMKNTKSDGRRPPSIRPDGETAVRPRNNTKVDIGSVIASRGYEQMYKRNR